MMDDPLPDMAYSQAFFSTDWHFRVLARLLLNAMQAHLREIKDIKLQQEAPKRYRERALRQAARHRIVDLHALRAAFNAEGHNTLEERFEAHKKSEAALSELRESLMAQRYDEVAAWLRQGATETRCFLEYVDQGKHPWVYGIEYDRAMLYDLLANRFEAEKDSPRTVFPQD